MENSSPQRVLEIFQNRVFKILRLSLRYYHPAWMIISNLAIFPPKVEPTLLVDSSLRSQDDLNHQKTQILKTSKKLQNEVNL